MSYVVGETMVNGKKKTGNPEVLGFIRNFIEHSGKDNLVPDYVYDTIHNLFRSGYCWHFAVMLQAVFERGKICWAAPFAHVVWVDNDSLPYDIEGLYSGEAYWFIPMEYLFVGTGINGQMHIDRTFRHISPELDRKFGPSRDALIDIMKRYCADTHQEYIPGVEAYLLPDPKELAKMED